VGRRGESTQLFLLTLERWYTIHYALIVLIQFWLQTVPYADLNGDRFVDFKDFTILHQVADGDFWVAKYNWFCENTYADGTTEVVEGFTYTIWPNEPVKYDSHPNIEGFVWKSQSGNRPVISMNYIFFEQIFSHLAVVDADQSIYVPPKGCDVDFDGFIDMLDLAVFCDEWLAETVLNFCDFNEDRVVDFKDLAELVRQME